MNTSPRPRNKNIRRFAALALVVGLAAWAVRWYSGTESKPDTTLEATFTVKRGPLSISIAQAGTIQAQQQQIITSEVEGQNAITFLVAEGSLVKPGDLLVQLDSSNLEAALEEQLIRVQNAEAAFIRSRENFSVVKIQIEGDTANAELNLRFAREDLNNYKEGEYRQRLLQADSKITLAEEELQLAARKLEWSEKLFEENYISQSDLDADRLSHNRAKLNLELAHADRKLLEEFTFTREMAKLESAVEQAARNLERVRLRAVADSVQAQADLNAKDAEWRNQQRRQKRIEDQIKKTRIVADRAGLVVYATSAKVSWRGGGEPLEVGQLVRERQELIYLPTADLMKAEVQVHESNLDKLQIGQPAVITVDALQGRTFMGKVSRIAPLPDANSMYMNPDLKIYRTEIQIDGNQPDLRTGMSCMADILIQQHEDAVYVPVQAVIRIDRQPSVYLRGGREFKPVPVEVGQDNNRMIQIISGLERGQEILLNPPLQAGQTAAAQVNGMDENGKARP